MSYTMWSLGNSIQDRFQINSSQIKSHENIGFGSISTFALRAWYLNCKILTSFSTGLYGRIEPRNPLIHNWDSAPFWAIPLPPQLEQNHRKIRFQWDPAAIPLSIRLSFLRSALAFKLLGDGDWSVTWPPAVRGSRVPSQTIPAQMGGGPSSYLAGSQWVGCTPPPRHAFNSRRSNC